MSLLDIAQSIKKEGFDPRKDSANGPAPIPAGEYQAILKSVKFNISEKGWESIQYCFEIRGGDYDGRVEYASFGTLDTWHGNLLLREVVQSSYRIYGTCSRKLGRSQTN